MVASYCHFLLQRCRSKRPLALLADKIAFSTACARLAVLCCLQNSESTRISFSLAAMVILVCLGARATFTFALARLHNRWRPETVNWKEQVIIW